MLIDFSIGLYGLRDVSALRRRSAATLCRCTTTLGGSGRRRALTRRRRALGRVALTLVANLDAVVAQLVAPVLADERPDLVLVIGADVLDRLVGRRARAALALLDDLVLELALLTLQNFELDLDDALDELRELLGEALDTAARQITGLVHGQR